MPRDSRSRRRRTAAQWGEILRRFESAGLGPRAFCRREGLALSSFHRWRGRPATVSAPLEFVELAPPSAPAVASGSWTVELSLPNGVRLRLQG